MTKSAPGRAFEHDDARISNAGGVRSDSAQGTQDAVKHGHLWIDKDGQLMHRTAAGVKLGRKDRNLAWVNAHGAPFDPDWLSKDKDRHWGDHALTAVPKGSGLQTARETFADCKAKGRKVEWEVKDVRPFKTKKALTNALALLAADAEAIFGADWRQHVEVKVLNTLSGGLPYALRVLKAAKAAGFTTMLLNHKKRSVRIGRLRAKYVDYVRGAWHGPSKPKGKR